MKTYILNTINRLKQKSETLDAQAILTGKKWLVFNDSGEQEVYNFFANGKVLISVNGVGMEHSWQYDPTDKSILIKTDKAIYTFNAAFLDKVVFALQLDGTQEYMFLIDQANRNLFRPKTKQELLDYYDNKERLLREAEEAEIRRLEFERQEAARRAAERARIEKEKQRILSEFQNYLWQKKYSDNFHPLLGVCFVSTSLLFCWWRGCHDDLPEWNLGKCIFLIFLLISPNLISIFCNKRFRRLWEEYKKSMTWEYTGPNVDKDLENLKENFNWKTYKK